MNKNKKVLKYFNMQVHSTLKLCKHNTTMHSNKRNINFNVKMNLHNIINFNVQINLHNIINFNIQMNIHNVIFSLYHKILSNSNK